VTVGRGGSDYESDGHRRDTVDAVVSAAGVAKFAPLDQLTDEDFLVSLNTD